MLYNDDMDLLARFRLILILLITAAISGIGIAALFFVHSFSAEPAAVVGTTQYSIVESIPDRGQEVANGNGDVQGSEAALDGGAEEASEVSTEDSEEVNETLVTADAIATSPELQARVLTFLSENGLDATNFALAYKNLTTGETCYFNELTQFDAASTYKLPLNLLYYDMQAEGTITGDTIVPGTTTPLSECHHQSLEYSNNELSEAMVDNYGSYDVMKRDMRRYMTLSDAETSEDYYHHNWFCARQMMDVNEYLYQHQSQYAEAMGYLEAAQPGEYFRTYLPNIRIAQKYGRRDGYQNCGGIVFADQPFVLAVYSCNTPDGQDTVSKAAKLFYDYQNGQ